MARCSLRTAHILAVVALAASLLCTFAAAHDHQCIHDSPEMEAERAEMIKVRAPQNYNHTVSDDGRHFYAAAVGSIRIVISTLDLDNPAKYCATNTGTSPDYKGSTIACSDETVFTAAKKSTLLNDIIPAALTMLSSAISVNQVVGALKVPSTSTCTYYTVPAAHVNPGVSNADYVLYVSAGPTAARVAAWSSASPRSSMASSRPKTLIASPTYVTPLIAWPRRPTSARGERPSRSASNSD